jgi:glutamate-5-semialdehyde dehydrogenase
MSVEDTIAGIAKKAKAASRKMARCPSDQKNRALLAIADLLNSEQGLIQTENAKDVAQASKQGLSNAMIDRLTVGRDAITAMVQGLKEVAELNDPVGQTTQSYMRPNGLEVSRVRIPLGVIGIIYESRPNVTVDAAALCLKAGNSVVLRGGSEALYSNRALAGLIARGLSAGGLPEAAVQVIPMREREAIQALLSQEEYVDVIIPRGGEGLIRYVTANSKIPVLKHYKGVCHVFVDRSADLVMAQEICLNAKVQRPGVCNAMETLLVHEDIAEACLPALCDRLAAEGVEIRGCEQTLRLIPFARAAVEADWPEEFLDLILAVRVVTGMDAALDHIARHNSNHTEAIVTQDYARARRFVKETDASVVLVNASTRFNDGGQLGLGAEIGISTSKLHAYGPMGVDELTTTKFVVFGDGQIRT